MCCETTEHKYAHFVAEKLLTKCFISILLHLEIENCLDSNINICKEHMLKCGFIIPYKYMGTDICFRSNGHRKVFYNINQIDNPDHFIINSIEEMFI